MKKVFTLITLALISVVSFAADDQDPFIPEGVEKSEVITLTARLHTTMSLDMDNEGIVFDFVTLDEYRNGLGAYEGNYASPGIIKSTANWDLSYRALANFTHTDGSTTMPLDNVGLTAKFTGKNKIKNYSDDPLALSQKRTKILGHNGLDSNAGDETDNAFTIYWEMGTMKGDMNEESIFKQDLKKGEYNTVVEFIASEVL